MVHCISQETFMQAIRFFCILTTTESGAKIWPVKSPCWVHSDM